MFGPTIEVLRDTVDRLQAQVRGVEAEELDWSVVGDEVVALERERERVDHLIGCLVSDLESRRAHVKDGARNMATWLSQRTGQRRDITGARCALAAKLRAVPATDAAVRAERLTGSYAKVLGRCLNQRTAEAFAGQEEQLVEIAETMSADELAHFVAAWLRLFDLDGPEPGDDGQDDIFHLSQTLEGRLKGSFDLGGELHLGCEHHHARIHAGDLVVRMVDGRPRFFLPEGRELVDPRAGPPRTGSEPLPAALPLDEEPFP